jgi:hypothetical protein
MKFKLDLDGVMNPSVTLGLEHGHVFPCLKAPHYRKHLSAKATRGWQDDGGSQSQSASYGEQKIPLF